MRSMRRHAVLGLVFVLKMQHGDRERICDETLPQTSSEFAQEAGKQIAFRCVTHDIANLRRCFTWITIV
jgi:hypothetical protein